MKHAVMGFIWGMLAVFSTVLCSRSDVWFMTALWLVVAAFSLLMTADKAIDWAWHDVCACIKEGLEKKE